MAGGPIAIAIELANFEPVDLALDGACIFWTRSVQFSDTDPGAIVVAPER